MKKKIIVSDLAIGTTLFIDANFVPANFVPATSYTHENFTAVIHHPIAATKSLCHCDHDTPPFKKWHTTIPSEHGKFSLGGT